ncbi:MAG: Smr/MutS family protein [Saccharofermentanales bacterium]
MATRIINLEEGRPSSEKAVMRLRLELATLRRVGIDCVKVVHGYGSTGTGGVIRSDARDYLRELLADGKIRHFCPGEEFGPFETSGRKTILLKPLMRNDRDWARNNEGITIVIV